MSQARLPPFPDELLFADRKNDAIAFLRRLGLPYWIASAHLGRWAAVVGVELDRLDHLALGRFVKAPE
jgi:hypothetical protein